MHRYGPTQCAMDLAAYPGVEKNMQELTQYSSFPQGQTKGKKGNLCERSMQYQNPENIDS